MNAHTIMNILYLILALAVLWVVLRFLLKLAGRVFACGCSLLVLAAIVFVVLRFVYKG